MSRKPKEFDMSVHFKDRGSLNSLTGETTRIRSIHIKLVFFPVAEKSPSLGPADHLPEAGGSNKSTGH